MGFKVSAKGIEPDDRLVSKICEIQTPKNKKEVESFIGLINYFGRLIPEFSKKIRPISEVRHSKNAAFQWTKACQTAFERLKTEISQSPIVQPYDVKKEATVTTDASKTAIAAILTQNGSPVIYVSRTLSNAE